MEAINDLLAPQLPRRLTTIEYRVGSPILRIIDRHIENGELSAELYVLEGWDPQWTDRRRLYTTRDPLHIEAFAQLRCQAKMFEYVSQEAYITTNPGMNWVIADSSLGYGLPAKQEFLTVLSMATDLLERGYGMEEEPFSELGLLMLNRRMSMFDWHQMYYHYLATGLFDAWVRSNQPNPTGVPDGPGKIPDGVTPPD